jgi:diguanylate cyclase (GGDEF)-like protein
MDKFQVLVVDDDKDIAAWYRTVLVLMGFEVETALTARQALAWLAANVPDLVLLDLHLGVELGGEDILYQIRSNTRFNQTRVIVVTGYPTTAEVITNLADLVMIKPIELEQLRGLVSRMAYSELEPKILPFRDPVTLLYNKEFFFTRLELACERIRRRHDFLYAVVVFEVQFHPRQPAAPAPDDTWMLGEISSRLKQNIRPTDLLARISGWEFAMLVEELEKAQDIQVILERVRLILCEPVRSGGEEYMCSVQFGVAGEPWKYKQPDDAFAAAEADLERARNLQGYTG